LQRPGSAAIVARPFILAGYRLIYLISRSLSQTKRQDERTARQLGDVSAKCLDESRSASVQAYPNIGVGDVSVQMSARPAFVTPVRDAIRIHPYRGGGRLGPRRRGRIRHPTFLRTAIWRCSVPVTHAIQMTLKRGNPRRIDRRTLTFPGEVTYLLDRRASIIGPSEIGCS